MNSMRNLDLPQQIALIRRTGESFKPVIAAAISGAISMASVALFIASTDQNAKVILLFVAGVSAMIAIAVALTYPQFQRAARATRVGRRVRGTLQLEISDVDSEDMTISGRISDGGGVWELKFGRPIGWKPGIGEWPCELIFLSDQRTPVLVQLNDGLLFPTKKSRKRYGRGK